MKKNVHAEFVALQEKHGKLPPGTLARLLVDQEVVGDAELEAA